MDPARFEALVHAHHATVFRAAWRVLRDTAAAEDVTQEVFVRVLDGRLDLERTQEPAGILAWGAARAALSRGRSDSARRRREERHAMTDERSVPRPEEVAEATERQALVHAALARLPEPQQAALVLRFQEGLTFAALGRTFGISEPSAIGRVQKALAALGRHLGALGGGGLAATLLADDGHALGAVLAASAPPPPAGLAVRLVDALAVTSSAGVAAGSSAGLGSLLGPGVLLAGAAAAALAFVLGRGDAAGRRGAADVAGPGAALPEHATASGGGASRPRSDADAGVRRAVAGAGGREAAPAAASEAAPARLRVQVRDADGAPVPGASVRAFVRAPGLKFPSESVQGATDGRGLGVLELPVEELDARLRGEPWALLVDHPAAPRVSTTVADLAAGEERTLAFALDASAAAAAFEVDVAVRDADGPVAGVEVALGHVAGDLAGAGVLRVEHDGVLTDPDGRVTLRGRWLGDKRVVVDGRAVGRTHELAELRVDGPGVHALEVTCASAWRVEGLARDVEGAPAVGAELTLYAHENGWRRPYAHDWWDEPASAAVDANGRFRLFADPPSGGALWLALPRWSTGGWSPFELAVPAPDGSLTLTLGREDDPRGLGLHLAELHGELVFPAGSRPPWWPADRVRVVAVPDDVEDGAALQDLVVALLLGDAEDGGAPSQTGVQQALAAPVLLLSDPQDPDAIRIDAPRDAAQQLELVPGASPDPGPHRFHRVGLRPGRHLLVARVHPFAPLVAGPFELGREQIRAGPRLELRPGIRLSGRVVDASGQPVEGALVTLAGHGPRGDARLARLTAWVRDHPRAQAFGDRLSARTDAEGRYSLEGVPADLDARIVAAHPTRQVVSQPNRTSVGR